MSRRDTVEQSLAKSSVRRYTKEEFEYRDDADSDDDYIGGGGFGSVFKARIKATGTVVAAKVLTGRSRSRRLNKGELYDLQKELSILENVQGHPNVVQIVGYCCSSISPTLLLEYVDGGHLRSLLCESDDPLIKKWSHRLDVSYQIANAMKYLHGLPNAVLHLDLKAENVLMSKRNVRFVAKISDFGLSKIKVLCSSSSGGSAAGTAGYIAPERLRGDFSAKENLERAKKADVFSFGILLWVVRELRPPFTDEPIKAVINERIKGDVRPRESPQEEVDSPSGYDDLMRRCYHGDPNERPTFEEACSSLIASGSDDHLIELAL